MAKKSADDAPIPLWKYLDELINTLAGHVPAALKQWDQTAIHQARVTTRRLKAGMDLVRPVLSSEHRKPLGKTLRKLRRQLGPLRDLDVMLKHLSQIKSNSRQTETARWLIAHFEQERQLQREQIADDSDSPAKILGRLGEWWGVRQELRETEEATASLLAQSLHEQMDAFSQQADILGASQVPSDQRPDPHELRIAGKALRYTLEMAAVVGHPLPRSVLSTFKQMQEKLGLWHDYVVLAERSAQAMLDRLLAHHQPQQAQQVLDLARSYIDRSRRELDAFHKLWSERGQEVAQTVRGLFPLTHPADAPPVPTVKVDELDQNESGPVSESQVQTTENAVSTPGD